MQVQTVQDGDAWLNTTSTDGPGISIGNKRIHLLPSPVSNVTAIRVVVNGVVGSGKHAASLRRLAVVGVEKCVGGGPSPPAPHSCDVPAEHQDVGMFQPGFGANVKWVLEDVNSSFVAKTAGTRTVLMKLDALSTANPDGNEQPNKIDLCLAAAPLDATPFSSGTVDGGKYSPGSYTNKTMLQACDATSESQVGGESCVCSDYLCSIDRLLQPTVSVNF